MPLSNRIIRGERAEEFSAWDLKTIGASYSSRVERLFSDVGALRNRPPVPYEDTLTEAELRLYRWEQQLKQREASITALEEATRQAATEAGQHQGYQTGWEAAQTERVQLVEACETLKSEFEGFKAQLAGKVLNLAVRVARKVLLDTVQAAPEQAGLALRQLMHDMPFWPRNTSHWLPTAKHSMRLKRILAIPMNWQVCAPRKTSSLPKAGLC
ncbi:MAG: hypothetical protein HC848_05295 [Limnobacter sp.]|nr:hypothetical protein [Limnobacter sp.]